VTSLLPQESYFCRQCQTRKEARAFEWTTAKARNGSYYPAARKICKLCCGDEGHKPCRTCKADKTIGDFYWIKSGNSDVRRPMPDCKVCWREAKNLRTKGHKTPPRRRSGPKPGTSYGGRRPAGWTPPPTAEQLAALHHSYSPPPGWVPMKWEDCA
jgi:hypothetical protein